MCVIFYIFKHDLYQLYFFSYLNDECLEWLAYKITLSLPHECALLYFVPAVTKENSLDNQHHKAKGKLTDKWKNTQSFIRKCTGKQQSRLSNTTQAAEDSGIINRQS